MNGEEDMVRGTTWLVMGTLLLLLLVAARGAPAADLDAAKENYELFCVKCHGSAGKGDGPGAATLATKPRDFTDCERMATYSDEQLFKAIKNGGEAVSMSKDMPAWKDGMDDDEIHGLVAYVRGFCKK
jgi:cytochrome c oxidase cbb3-type subunit III